MSHCKVPAFIEAQVEVSSRQHIFFISLSELSVGLLNEKKMIYCVTDGIG